jgi:hypothetical protein
MNITLNELLTLLGRLDDAPGFDTPRERFRRFLVEHVTDVQTARPLVEECQRSVGEQHHRALQDLVVLLGRFMRFETTFGTYERLPGGVKVDGQWRSRGRLDVVLEIRTDQTTEPGFESLTRAVSAVAATTQTEVEARIGLCVVARHYAGRGRLEQAAALEKQADVRVVSVQSLLSLATKFSDDRLTHGEVVKLLRSGFALDFFIDLLDRPADAARPREIVQDAAPVPPPTAAPQPVSIAAPPAHLLVPAAPEFWVATLVANDMASPEQLLASVIVERRVLGICHDGVLQYDGAPGDWVCFFVPGQGIVGHARLESVVENGAAVIRNADRFSRVYQLGDVELYDEPIVQALRAQRPFVVPPLDAMLAGPCLSPISRQDFLAMTASRGVPMIDRTVSSFSADVAIERRSRSHA